MPVQIEKFVQFEEEVSARDPGVFTRNSTLSQSKPGSQRPPSDLDKSLYIYFLSAKPPFELLENRSEMERDLSQLNSMHEFETNPTSDQEDSKNGKQTSNFDWKKLAGGEDDTYSASALTGTPWPQLLERRALQIDESFKKSAPNSLTS